MNSLSTPARAPSTCSLPARKGRPLGARLTALALAAATLHVAQLAAAKDFILDKSTCEDDFGGSWDIATNQCDVFEFELVSGDSLQVPLPTTLALQGKGSNSGILTITGTLTNDDDFLNRFGATLEFDPAATLTNQGDFTNSGELNSAGALENQAAATFTNGGTFGNHGALTNDGSLVNLATLENFGSIANRSVMSNDKDLTNTGTLTNDSTLTNHGTLNNSGSVSSGGAIANDTGTIHNTGTFSLKLGATLLQTNSATFENVDGATLSSAAAISNTLASTLTNSATFTMTAGASFNNDASVVSNATASALWRIRDASVSNSAGSSLESAGVFDLFGGLLTNDAASIHNTGQFTAFGVVNQQHASLFNNGGGRLLAFSLQNDAGSRVVNASRADVQNTFNHAVVVNDGQWNGALFSNFCDGALVNHGTITGLVSNLGGTLQNTGLITTPLELSCSL